MSINKVIQAGVKNGCKQFTETAQRFRDLDFSFLNLFCVSLLYLRMKKLSFFCTFY